MIYGTLIVYTENLVAEKAVILGALVALSTLGCLDLKIINDKDCHQYYLIPWTSNLWPYIESVMMGLNQEIRIDTLFYQLAR